jgi:hypothetical protein
MNTLLVLGVLLAIDVALMAAGLKKFRDKAVS